MKPRIKIEHIKVEHGWRVKLTDDKTMQSFLGGITPRKAKPPFTEPVQGFIRVMYNTIKHCKEGIKELENLLEPKEGL